MKSTTDNERAEMSCFARLRFEMRLVIGYCSGLLMYANLYGAKDLDKRDKKGVIRLSVIEFKTYALRLRDDVKHSSERRHDS